MRYFRLKTKAASEPVTTDFVKLHTRVAHSVEDSLIDSWIVAGRKHAEDYQHRAFVQQSWVMTFDEFPPSIIEIPRPPLVSIDSIKYYDDGGNETVVDSSNYFVDLTSEIGRVAFYDSFSWPSITLRPLNGVEVTFTAGYSVDGTSVPDIVKNAICIYCTHMYENRESESGTIPKEFYDLLRPDRMAVY